MDENAIKEALSTAFIEIVAGRNGFTTAKPSRDFGTDIRINEIKDISLIGKPNFSETEKFLDVQLKCTTDSGVRRNGGYIYYDLKVNSYNRMAKKVNNQYPLFLVLFVLPDDDLEWLRISKDDIVLKKHAFWYLPPNDTNSPNSSTQVIQIPEENIFDSHTLSALFTKIFI